MKDKQADIPSERQIHRHTHTHGKIDKTLYEDKQGAQTYRQNNYIYEQNRQTDGWIDCQVDRPMNRHGVIQTCLIRANVLAPLTDLGKVPPTSTLGQIVKGENNGCKSFGQKQFCRLEICLHNLVELICTTTFG